MCAVYRLLEDLRSTDQLKDVAKVLPWILLSCEYDIPEQPAEMIKDRNLGTTANLS